MNKKTIIKNCVAAALLLHSQSLLAGNALAGQSANVDSSKPWSFWYWMYGTVNKPSVKADLEGMARVGLGGTYLMPIRSTTEKPEYEGKAEQLSPEFWRMVDYSMHVADSLGLGLGVHICDGFALAGGPWFSEEESMQRVIFADTLLNITEKKGRKVQMRLPQYAANTGWFKDIVAYAMPEKYEGVDAVPVNVTWSDNVTYDKGVYKADTPCNIDFDFGREVSPLAIEITPSSTNIQCQRFTLWHSTDGVNYEVQDVLNPSRQGWQNYLYPSTYAIHPGTYRYYRVTWTPEGTEPGNEDLDAAKWKAVFRLKNIRFMQQPKIHQWEGKTGLAWRVDKPTTMYSDDVCVPLADLIPLTIDADGQMTAPVSLGQGRWRILRIGHASQGMTNATAGGAKGLECDKFSAKAVNKLVDNWFCEFKKLSDKHNSPLKAIHVDSWECGCQNWCETFAEEFKKRRGYDLMPWMPVMAGIPVESIGESERVLRDVRLTINDLVNDVFYTTLRKRADEMGMLFSSEAIAPTMVSDGLDHYRYADMPMGEYWLNSPTHDKPNDMLDAISGAHVYGKKIIQAEGFTEVRGVWDEDPYMIKTLLDRNYALGINKLFFHVNALNPWLDRKPGMTLDGIGLFFQRDQIWYEEAKPFVDYIRRSQALLQMGRPVQDIAVYCGDEMPRRAVLPERLVDILPGLMGKSRVEAEMKRLANVGVPLEESPVGVRHSAGIIDTRDWVNPLRGYQYDTVNPDALLNLSDAKDGRMQLKGGASYRVLVVPGCRPMNPDNIITAESSAKIDVMREAGVVIVDKPFTDSDFAKYGLQRDMDIVRAYLQKDNAQEVLTESGNGIKEVLKDAEKDVAYTHRSAAEGEIYFLSNQTDETLVADVKLRDGKGTPYIYNATDNTLAVAKLNADGTLQVEMPGRGSCFVLFPSSTIESLTACLPEQPVLMDATSAADNVEVAALEGPWQLSFREAKFETTLDKLISWTELEEGNMKYFSGHGRYTTEVKLKKKPSGTERLVMDNVQNIAHVWVNGVDCGIAWTKPFAVNIGNALRKGKNVIEIEVVNTWANALRGADEGKAPYEGIWTNATYRMKQPHLLPAGLLGKVVILGNM